jgi:cold shock protein
MHAFFFFRRVVACRDRFNCREASAATGTVKWFNSQKGYGFIAPQGGGGDVFVHITAVERAGLSNLNEAQTVEYELETGRNGKTSAANLRIK